MKHTSLVVFLTMLLHPFHADAAVKHTKKQARPSCAIVVSTTSLASAECKKLQKQAVVRLKEICRLKNEYKLNALLDGEGNSSVESLAEARTILARAHQEFEEINLAEAEKLARKAISLLDLNHRALDSYDELSQALVFLGMVLTENHKYAEAKKQFLFALVVNPGLRLDPRTTPPQIVRTVDKLRSKLLHSRRRGSLSIKTDPPGAELLFDGKQQGTTPVSLKSLLPGRHYLRVRKTGYIPWDGVISVTPDEITGSEVFLKPTIRARLASSSRAETKQILGKLARDTKTERLILLRVQAGEENIEKSKTQLYLASKGTLTDEGTLGHFLAVSRVSRSHGPRKNKHTAVPIHTKSDVRKATTPVGVTSNSDSQLKIREEKNDTSVFKSWWFWTVLGVVVTSTAVTLPLVLDGGGDLHITIMRPQN